MSSNQSNLSRDVLIQTLEKNMQELRKLVLIEGLPTDVVEVIYI